MSKKFKFSRNDFESILQLNFTNIKGWKFLINEASGNVECKIVTTNNFDTIHPSAVILSNLYEAEDFQNNWDNYTQLNQFFQHPNGTNVDFYYLSKSDYMFAMSSNPTEIYVSFSIIDMGASILNDLSGNSNNVFYIMKLEMVRSGLIQTINISGVETPLYLLAPPCPPVWRSRSIYTVVQQSYPLVSINHSSKSK